MVVATDVVTEAPAADGPSGFRLRLRNFEGPFDLLLTLISQHQLDVTEVALAEVTDEFISYTRSLGSELELDQTTEFLVVAATLLDLKAARLLPAGEVDDDEDLALLEARDLLFARLLQYRAYKQVAQLFGELESAALRRYPRSVSVEECYVGLLPEVLLGVDPSNSRRSRPPRSVHARFRRWASTICTHRQCRFRSRPPGSWNCCGNAAPACGPRSGR